MNRATSNLFMVSSNGGIVSPVSTSPTIYPLVLKAALQENNSRIETARLIRLAEILYSKRDYSTLEQVAQILVTTIYSQDAGIYYLALLENKKGNVSVAQSMLEPLTRYASPIIRARANWTLAASQHKVGDISNAIHSYVEAANIAKGTDSLTLCVTHFQLSLLKSQTGDHHGAIEDLEQAWPIVQFASQSHPHLFYWFHNDLSYELAEIGRIDQAREHSKIASESPLIDVYPEIRQTSIAIEEKAREAEHKPVIIIIQKPEPEPESNPAVVIPVPIICFHLSRSYKINLRGSLYLSHAPASIYQRECIKYSITRRGPPQFSLL